MEKEVQPEVVVFDLGGVLIDWNPRHVYRQITEDEEEIEWFLEHVCTDAWNAQQDAGRSFEEATNVLLAQYPEHEDWIRAYYDRWEDMLGGRIDGSVAVLEELKAQQVPLYALTNWSAESFPVAEARYGFLQLFDGIVVSGRVRMIKPDPAIFNHLVEVFALEPAATVFIDDRLENVQAAQKLGFQGLHFETPEQLRRDLEAAGLL